jgi:hypothetical protein
MFEVINVGGTKTVTSKQSVNHVYVVDCSGSMSYDLPKIRQHLKNIVSVVTQPADTFSVIWFSGRNQCGVVFENMPVSDASSLAMMHKAIDRFLVPVCLTSFVDPIDLAMTLSLKPGNLGNFVMLTDGYDNQNQKQKILDRTAELKTVFDSVTFIEYGYYADRDMLAKMAESVNGMHLFAEGYTNYEDVMESAISGTARSTNIEVSVNKKAKHVVFVYNGNIRIVNVDNGVAKVPEDVDQVHSIVPSDVLSKHLSEEHLYLILFYAAKTNNVKLVWDCLQVLGDVALVETYQNAFTKQELSEFLSVVEACVLNPSRRYADGKSENAVPKKDVPTIPDLLNILSESSAQLVLDSPFWKYNRTTKASEAQDPLPRFIKSPMSRASMRGLVFNSSRPNISIGITQNGTVELPENDFGLTSVPSHIFRNYTIIRDGIKNVKQLPVVVPTDVFDNLSDKFANTVIEQTPEQTYVVFELSQIPVVNRKRVEGFDVEYLKSTIVNLELQKARLKVINALIKEHGGSEVKIAGLIEQYGQEAANWLSSIGVRDYGFGSVNTKTVEATDAYISVEVDYKLKGLSSFPTIEAVRKKLAEKKKLNLGDTVIKDFLEHYGNMSKEDLETNKTALTKVKRMLESELSDMVYTIILGRIWFTDDPDQDEYVTDIDIYGQAVPLTLFKQRKEIKI